MNKIKNRYLILVAAAIVNFSFGSAYIWSVFQPAAKEKFTLSAGAANRPFNIFMGCFVLGNILGGKLQQKWGTRKVVLSGSFLMCVGFLLTALVPSNQAALLSITYGVFGGTGAGVAYNALVAGVQKWFPDKKGMVTGIIICTTGAPGLIMTPICNAFIVKYGFSGAMIAVASIYAVICFGFGWMVQEPTREESKHFVIHSQVKGLKQYTTSEMIKTKQYYLIAGAMMFAVPAYFLMNPMMKSLGVERGLTEAGALSGVMIASVLNVLGRLSAPWISDRLGRKRILLSLFGISMGAVLTLTVAKGFIFLICVALVSFSYGGFFGIFPVVSADYFGSKYAGMNYGVVMIGYGVISLACPSIVGLGLTASFVIAAIACVVGMVCVVSLQKPELNQRKEKEKTEKSKLSLA